MAVTPVTSITSFSSQQNFTITLIVGLALDALRGKIVGIETQPLYDADDNHKITVMLRPSEKEPASLFALKCNGRPKTENEAVEELIAKIENFLNYREDPSKSRLSSGAFISCKQDVTITEENGHLTVNGKIAVSKQDDGRYFPIPGSMIQTYTHIEALKEGELIILKDDHEQIRDDGKEGLIFNVNQPLVLSKDQLTDSEHLPDQAEYLILYRRRDEAKGFKA